ncbi:restriction endonuclease subunit S [Staphylococcus hominis]|uniref:restriction endonuclease subunit S n=1 Tax=Staphylococcus hominis TaxID=1290 RepID=UPI00287A69DF|nr:restriction endonuclease subunit S [Staphylococcus hominis]MDS3909657.1 restriction endonuclease subunit S [Staphylococcus hominis]
MTERANTPELRFPEFRDEWEIKIIKELFNVVSGSTPLRSNTSYYENGNIPWVKTTDLNNSLINDTSEKVTDIALNNLKLLPKDTVLIAMYGGFNQIGRTGILNIKATTNQAISALIKKGNYNSKFLQSYLNFNVKQWRRFAASSRKDPNITKKDIEKFKIPYTCLEEQEKIGTFFSKLDQQIELEEKKLELLEQQKKGYMQKIFTQKLRFKDKTGNIYPNWKTTELKDILEKIIDNRGKTPDNAPSEKYPLLEVNALGYYHPSYKKVSKFVSENTYNNWFREHLKENDILFSTVGNTGIVSLMDNYKAVIAQNIVGLRVNNNNIPSFVYYMLSYWENQKKIKRIQMGAVQPSVKVSQFKFIKYLIPIKDEQEKIANLLSEIDKVINKQLIKIEVLKQRKQGLLQKMFV